MKSYQFFLIDLSKTLDRIAKNEIIYNIINEGIHKNINVKNKPNFQSDLTFAGSPLG